MMRIGRKHTQGFCSNPDYWGGGGGGGQAPTSEIWGGGSGPWPPGSYSTAEHQESCIFAYQYFNFCSNSNYK